MLDCLHGFRLLNCYGQFQSDRMATMLFVVLLIMHPVPVTLLQCAVQRKMKIQFEHVFLHSGHIRCGER